MDETEKYLRLLELTTKEEQYYLREHQLRIGFFAGLSSTLIAATFAGFLKSTDASHFYGLIVGPVLVFVTSAFAVKATFRLYQRFLEVITKKAKLEQILGLIHEYEISMEKKYWHNEPVIATRHLKDRMDFKSSSKMFVKNASRGGYHKWSKWLFILFQIISILMVIGLVYVANQIL
jgi:hypothetical protein